MTKIQQLYKLGQSVWLDYISRGFINSNGLKHMIDLGIHGVTSNPTIFEKAISDSSDYDSDIHKLAREGKSTLEIYIPVLSIFQVFLYQHLYLCCPD